MANIKQFLYSNLVILSTNLVNLDYIFLTVNTVVIMKLLTIFCESVLDTLIFLFHLMGKLCKFFKNCWYFINAF